MVAENEGEELQGEDMGTPMGRRRRRQDGIAEGPEGRASGAGEECAEGRRPQSADRRQHDNQQPQGRDDGTERQELAVPTAIAEPYDRVAQNQKRQRRRRQDLAGGRLPP